MKPHLKLPCTILATALAATLQLTAHAAAVPLAWEVRPNNPAPAAFDRHHGETIHLTATFLGFGELPFEPDADVRLWYQTNGMGQAWWSAPATVQSNVLSATWSPALDPGADRVSLFFGAPSNVYASAVLRLRHSPGFTPSELTLPVQRLDFAAVELCNISALTNGWSFGTENAVRKSGDTMSGSLTIGTRDQGVFLDPSGNASLSYGDGAIFLTNPDFFTLAGLENGRIAYRTIYYPDGDGQLALTSDIPAAPGNYAAVSNAAMSAAAQTNDFLRLTGGTMTGDIDMGGRHGEGGVEPLDSAFIKFMDFWIGYGELGAGFGVYEYDGEGGLFAKYLFNGGAWGDDYGADKDVMTRADLADALGNIDFPDPDLSGYATKTALNAVSNDLADVRTESALVYRLYSGSNVVCEVTNYNSQVHAPTMRLMQLNESNEYVTVWAETNGLTRTLNSAAAYTDSATNELKNVYAPRAWSRTTSGLGADAPSNTTWISTPRTVIAGGLEYAKIVDTYGEVWVLTSNGMAADFNPDTNAYFRITADDGTPVFSIEKSDAQVIGANASGIVADAASVVMPVGVVSAEHPTMYWRQQLESGQWADETTPPTGATVTWSGTTGAWVCTVTWSGTRPSSMFFKFTFLQEGGVMIRNNATTDISAGIYVNGVKFVPSVSGNNLIWTKQ